MVRPLSAAIAGLAACLAASSANAATYGFSFSNVDGSVRGDVGGYIALPNGDGTFAASSVAVRTAPSALGCSLPYDVIANFPNTSANSFTVFHRLVQAEFSVFSAWDFVNVVNINRGLSLNDAAGAGTQLVFSDGRGGGGETADEDSTTLVFFSADVPLPAAAPLLIAGRGGLAALGRKRRA